MRTVIKTITSDIDDQNRFFIWTAFSDGSAKSAEITRHSSHLFSAKQTWSADHDPDSDEAKMIHSMQTV